MYYRTPVLICVCKDPSFMGALPQQWMDLVMTLGSHEKGTFCTFFFALQHQEVPAMTGFLCAVFGLSHAQSMPCSCGWNCTNWSMQCPGFHGCFVQIQH